MAARVLVVEDDVTVAEVVIAYLSRAGYHLDAIRFLPKPAGEIPIWIGGGVEASYRRAITRGDGFHVVGLKPPEVAPIVERLRRDRPEPSFTISARRSMERSQASRSFCHGAATMCWTPAASNAAFSSLMRPGSIP